MCTPATSSASSSSLANGSAVYSGAGAAQRNGHDEAGGELLLRFREACKRADGLQPELNNPQKLALYGLFKQATDPNGRSPTAPSRLNLIARAKWEAWYEVRHVSAAACEHRTSLSSQRLHCHYRQHAGARLEPRACDDGVHRKGGGGRRQQ
jgi:acyl-CoA-binding protein